MADTNRGLLIGEEFLIYHSEQNV